MKFHIKLCVAFQMSISTREKMAVKLLALVAIVVASTIASPVPDVFTKRQGRIVGGFDVTDVEQFPHQVSLRTAAHCELNLRS